jgi:putative ABC transport system permease protein
MEQLRQDIRLAIRLFRRSPVFTAVALLTLTLGIGANTAIFSIVNGVILRPLSYPKPEQLMYLTTRFGAFNFREFWVSPPEYLEFREINRSFAAVGAYTTGEVNVTAGDAPLRARSANVDEHLLTALGVHAEHGRVFGKGETDIVGPPPAPGTPPPAVSPIPAIAILSHELWQRAFGGRPIVGQSIEVDGRRREVIGILPTGVDLMENHTEIWLPLGLNPANRLNRGNHYLYLIGRLKDGVTPAAAQTELTSLVANWGERVGIPSTATGVASHVFSPRVDRGTHILQMKPLSDQMLGGVARSIWVLQAAVGLVLLIACANLANLLLARAETRQREFAVRTAIGATRGRLLKQFVTEGVLLSVAGSALGVVMARLGVAALLRVYPDSLPRTSEVTVDAAVLLFTLLAATACGVVFGLAPLVHTRLKGLAVALKEGGAKGTTAAARHRVRRALVVVEVALAVMLVVGAGLLVRTVYNLTHVDAGFNRSRLVTFSVTLPRAAYPLPSRRWQAYQTLLGRLRSIAGVQSVSGMTGLPPNRPLNANDTEIDNYDPPPQGPYENVDYYQNVTTDYFDTMGIPIVQGRSFQPADAASGGMVAVVNETLVNTFWKGLNPIGQRLRPCCGDQIPWRTVIGVAKDVKQGGVDRKTGTELYFFIDQVANVPPPRNNAPETMNLVLRTTLPPASLAATIESAVRDTDRTVPVVRLREMEDVFAEAISRPRLLAQLIGAFAALSLLLAAIGTYGVLSYIVAERRREIGIRLALGAERSGVLTQVMRQGLLLAFMGVVGGLAGALGINRLIASLLFGIQPTDAPTMVGVAATISLVAAVACWLPAWRASRLDPNLVLRDD